MTPTRTVRRLLDEHGTTYAEATGITLRHKPAPLYQLLVLTMLSSTRISAEIAVVAAHERFSAGWRTPEKMRVAGWRQQVDALGRASYRRYDGSTATKLEEGATWLLEPHDETCGACAPRATAASTGCWMRSPRPLASGRPVPGSSAARCRRCGPRCRRSSTNGPSTGRRSWTCRPLEGALTRPRRA